MKALIFVLLTCMQLTVADQIEDLFADMMSTMDELAKKSGISCPADVLMIVDARNLRDNSLELIKEFLSKVIEGLTVSPSGDHAAVALYDGNHQLLEVSDHSGLHKQLINAISNLRPSMHLARKSVDQLLTPRTDVNQVVLVIAENGRSPISTWNLAQYEKLGKVIVVDLDASLPRNENVFRGPQSYGQVVKTIKKCTRADSNEIATTTVSPFTVRFLRTATDSYGRFLIPNPKFTSQGVLHYNDKPGFQILSEQQSPITTSFFW